MDLSNENVIHIRKDGIQYLQFRKLLEFSEIIHAYSLGLENNFRTSNFKEINDKDVKDYKKITRVLGSNYINIVKPYQMHTDNIKIVKSKININCPDINNTEYENSDGLITNMKNIMLTTTNADCILLLFYDPIRKVIANIHSGWRGTVQRISIKAVEKMKSEYNSKPEDIICCICPSIRKCHFEVEKDVKELFEKEFNDLEEIKGIIEEKIPNKKWNIDTVLINKILLKKQGLKEKNIIDSNICSVCNSNLMHSYRVEKKAFKLNTALIEIK